MSHYNYAELLKKSRIRRGECPECGDATCSCKTTSKTAGFDADAIVKHHYRAIPDGSDEMFLDQELHLPDGRVVSYQPTSYRSSSGFVTGKLPQIRDEKATITKISPEFAAEAARVKYADIDPNIRSSVDDSKPNGLDVQQPLLRNPYSTGTAGDPNAAMQFENGYQFAQSMGHMNLSQNAPQHIQSWTARPKPWRDGFAQAARGMGCGNVASQLDAANKIADRKYPMTLPNFPISTNFKIASALGTMLGGLSGAALGAGAGHLASGMDFSHHDAPLPPAEIPVHGHIPDFAAQRGWDTLTPANAPITAAESTSPEFHGHNMGLGGGPGNGGEAPPNLGEELLQLGDHAVSAHPAESIGAGAGALLGGTAGSALSQKRQPYPPMGAPKMATAYFKTASALSEFIATEYFEMMETKTADPVSWLMRAAKTNPALANIAKTNFPARSVNGGNLGGQLGPQGRFEMSHPIGRTSPQRTALNSDLGLNPDGRYMASPADPKARAIIRENPKYLRDNGRYNGRGYSPARTDGGEFEMRQRMIDYKNAPALIDDRSPGAVWESPEFVGPSHTDIKNYRVARNAERFGKQAELEYPATEYFKLAQLKDVE